MQKMNCLKWFFDIETVLMINWIVWIRSVWLNRIAWNRNVFDNQTVPILNWIVWNRTTYLYKNRNKKFDVKYLTKVDNL